MSELNFDPSVESVTSIPDLAQIKEVGVELINYLQIHKEEVKPYLLRQTDNVIVVRDSLRLPLLHLYIEWLETNRRQSIHKRFGIPLPEITYSLPDDFAEKARFKLGENLPIPETLRFALSLVDQTCLEAICFRYESGLNFIKQIAKCYENYQTAVQKLKKEADEIYARTTPVYTFGGGDRPAQL